MKNAAKLIALILAFFIFCSEVMAAPPMYVSDPDCTVSGTVKNAEFRKGDRGEQYQECQKPMPAITDCDWILPAGEDKYLTTLQVSGSINDQSADDSVICGNIYPAGQERAFSISVDLFKQWQLKNGDIISGNVMRGGEFSSLQKVGPNLSASQELYYFIMGNILWFIALILIVIIVVFAGVKKIKRS